MRAVHLAALASGLLARSFMPVAAEPSAEVFIPSFVDTTVAGNAPLLDPGTTIRFVTGDDYPPFNVLAPGGMLAGFNVDLARALCDVLKVSCTIQSRPWSAIIPAVVGREADAAIASLAITPSARRLVSFTQPTYRTPARFLSRTSASGMPVSPERLAGQKVGVRAGTAQEAYLRTFFPGVLTMPYSTGSAARQALKAGDVEAVFDDGVGAAVWLNSDEPSGCCAFRGGPYTEPHFFGEGAGIAVRKSDGALRRALDAALARLTASGRFGDLYLKYFPVGFY